MRTPESTPRIYVDLDDVLCETAAMMSLIAEEEFGKGAPFHELTSFNVEEALKLTPEEGRRVMEIIHRPNVLGSLPLVEGAVSALREIQHLPLDIVLVTGRPPSTSEISEAWLAKHEIPHVAFLHVDKYGRRDPASGGCPAMTMQELGRLGFRLAIEDSGEVAAVLARDYHVAVTLLDRPWNRIAAVSALEAEGRIRRCSDWSEALISVRETRATQFLIGSS